MDISYHTLVEFEEDACLKIIYKAILDNKDVPKYTSNYQVQIPIKPSNELMIFSFINGSISGYLMTKNKAVIDWAEGK